MAGQTFFGYGNYSGSNTGLPWSATGHPGKYYKSYTVTANGQHDFTGSRAGVSAVIVQTHGGASLHLTGGGTIPASSIESDGLVELSLSQITSCTSAVIHALKSKESGQ